MASPLADATSARGGGGDQGVPQGLSVWSGLPPRMEASGKLDFLDVSSAFQKLASQHMRQKPATPSAVWEKASRACQSQEERTAVSPVDWRRARSHRRWGLWKKSHSTKERREMAGEKRGKRTRKGSRAVDVPGRGAPAHFKMGWASHDLLGGNVFVFHKF